MPELVRPLPAKLVTVTLELTVNVAEEATEIPVFAPPVIVPFVIVKLAVPTTPTVTVAFSLENVCPFKSNVPDLLNVV